jgi:hypothetical protein
MFFGPNAGSASATGTQNFALGGNTLGALTTGNNNVAIGNVSLNALTSGAGNVAVGFNAAKVLVKSGSNVLLGANAGATFTGNSSGADNNTGVGNAVMPVMTTGKQNTALGASAEFGGVTTGTQNVTVGYFATSGAGAAVNRVTIGTSVTNDADNQIMIGNASATALVNNGDGQANLGSTSHRWKGLYLKGGTLEIDGVATTGAQTATFTATNKPGAAGGTTPAKWLPITMDGTTYYIPAFT